MLSCEWMVRDTLLLWICIPNSGVTYCGYLKQQVYGWVECLSQATGCTTILKIQVFICFLESIYEFNYYAFYFVHHNELYVVVVKLLATFMFLTSMGNYMRLIVMLFAIQYLNVYVNQF